MYEEATQRAQAAAQASDAQRDPINGFIAHCISVYFDWQFIAALEIVMVARTDSDLMDRIGPVIHDYRTAADEAWIRALKNSGVARPRAERILSMTLNIVRGMAVGNLWGVDPTGHKKELLEWTEYVKSTLMARSR